MEMVASVRELDNQDKPSMCMWAVSGSDVLSYRCIAGATCVISGPKHTSGINVSTGCWMVNVFNSFKSVSSFFLSVTLLSSNVQVDRIQMTPVFTMSLVTMAIVAFTGCDCFLYFCNRMG